MTKKSSNKTQNHTPAPSGEPKTLGALLADYARTSDEPFAVLLRECMHLSPGTSSFPSATPLEQWMDGQEVMQKLNISPRTMQNLRTSGVLPYTIFGGRCFYKRADLERLLEQGYRIDGNTTTYVEKGGWRDDD